MSQRCKSDGGCASRRPFDYQRRRFGPKAKGAPRPEHVPLQAKEMPVPQSPFRQSAMLSMADADMLAKER